jgi:hypothetical protein
MSNSFPLEFEIVLRTLSKLTSKLINARQIELEEGNGVNPMGYMYFPKIFYILSHTSLDVFI